MLFMSKNLFNRPVMSLRTGSRVATAIEPIINPHNLKILGWWCASHHKSGRQVLLTDDVREIMPSGIAVNDEDVLSSPDDLVRHQEILNIRFQLIGKNVKTKRRKLGKVADFSYNDGVFVQKLYVSRPITKLLSSQDTLLIDRSQIIEVTDSYILVSDAELRATVEETVPAGAVIAP